jgi:Na+/glutamate symporter
MLVKKFAFKSKAFCAAVETGLFPSLVLSTFQTYHRFIIPEMVPVKAGELKVLFKLAIDAFNAVVCQLKLVCSNHLYCLHFLINLPLFYHLKRLQKVGRNLNCF